MEYFLDFVEFIIVFILTTFDFLLYLFWNWANRLRVGPQTRIQSSQYKPDMQTQLSISLPFSPFLFLLYCVPNLWLLPNPSGAKGIAATTACKHCCHPPWPPAIGRESSSSMGKSSPSSSPPICFALDLHFEARFDCKWWWAMLKEIFRDEVRWAVILPLRVSTSREVFFYIENNNVHHVFGEIPQRDSLAPIEPNLIVDEFHDLASTPACGTLDLELNSGTNPRAEHAIVLMSTKQCRPWLAWFLAKQNSPS